MKLYWSIGSQPGRAVKTLLDIGKIPCELIRMNVLKKQLKTESYLKLYPQGTIPLLVDGDFVVGQSSAILTYLCEKYPHLQQYHGLNIHERASVNQSLSWYQNNFRVALFKPFRKYLAHVYQGVKFYQDERDELWKNMLETINQFQSHMTAKQQLYVSGNRPSIADLLYHYELTNLQYFRADLANSPWIDQWNTRVALIPEVAAVTKEWSTLALQRAELFTSLSLPKR